MDDLIGFLLNFVGVDVTDRAEQRAIADARRRKRRRKAIVDGRAFTVRGRLRWPDGGFPRWRSGRLRLTKERAVWVPRCARSRAVALDHRVLVAKSARLSRKTAVLRYSLRGSSLDIAVRRRDLG